MCSCHHHYTDSKFWFWSKNKICCNFTNFINFMNFTCVCNISRVPVLQPVLHPFSSVLAGSHPTPVNSFTWEGSSGWWGCWCRTWHLGESISNRWWLSWEILLFHECLWYDGLCNISLQAEVCFKRIWSAPCPSLHSVLQFLYFPDLY